MIKITYYQNALIVSGHANYAEHGKDIVCAGISAIVYGALNWFDQEKTKIIVDDGFIKIIVNKNDIKGLEYLDLINLQIQAILSNYQKYILFQKINNIYKGD